MLKMAAAAGIALVLLATTVSAIDWPIKLGFQLGFNIRVVPGPDDMSGHLGLAVVTDKILSDKQHSITVTGTITNYGDVQRDAVDMRFAVTSYVGIGASRGVASVAPNSIPPGGTARFTVHISLDSPKPQYAMYTITAGNL